MVMRGTANLFGQYFQEHHEVGASFEPSSPQPAEGWMKRDGYRWTETELQWFKDRGCEWVKPSMEPGDFVLWDSRTVHYGAAPLDDKKRFAICA